MTEGINKDGPYYNPKYIARIERELVEAKADIKTMWKALDDIDTYGDMFKPEIGGYFKAVCKKVSEGKSTCSSDGYEIFYRGDII